MSDVGSDLEAAMGIAVAAQRRLHAKDPAHELVAFINIEDDEAGNEAWARLISSFGKYPERLPEGATERAFAWGRYLTALEVALGERPGPQARGVTASSTNVVAGDLGDDFPF